MRNIKWFRDWLGTDQRAHAVRLYIKSPAKPERRALCGFTPAAGWERLPGYKHLQPERCTECVAKKNEIGRRQNAKRRALPECQEVKET